MKRKFWIPALVLASTCAVPAFAADNGVYLGASVGYSSLSEDFEGTDFNSNATAFKAILGWRFLDWLAVEGNYVNFGSMDDEVLGERINVDSDGLTLSAVAFVPVGPVDLFARVGVIDWSADVSVSDIEDFGDNGTDFTWGAGVQFRLGSLALRAEYESFDLSGTNINLISAGLTWTFF